MKVLYILKDGNSNILTYNKWYEVIDTSELSYLIQTDTSNYKWWFYKNIFMTELEVRDEKLKQILK